MHSISNGADRSKRRRILIVGGVAGGASCAARARRLSEEPEIIMFERGPYVSFANCGLPYYIGDVITEEDNLIIAKPQLFRDRFNIDVRVQNEVTAIDRKNGEVEVKNLINGDIYREPFDALLLSPGSSPIRPPLPGIDLPGIFTLRTVPDSRQIRDWIVDKKVKRVVVVGGGFIGLEMAENLAMRGISVSIVEMLPQLMPALDPEMVLPLQKHLTDKGVSLHLNNAVAGFEPNRDGNVGVVKTKSGEDHNTDMVILAIGVRPEVGLARDAGLEIGDLGGIRVDDQMRTSDERIWAVGDAIEVRDIVTGHWMLIPLAGPANRQGRIAADVIMGRDSRFRGVQATAVCKAFDLTIASTGASEKIIQRYGIGGEEAKYEKIYLYPGNHVGYYPGAKEITMKLIFSTEDGRVLGAQAIGEEGVDKRIDVIAMAIQRNSTVFDLAEAELCYSPQFGAAKDPVNLAGMIAANILNGDLPTVHWGDIDHDSNTVIDVREPDEFEAGHVEGAINIPLGSLRNRMDELPENEEMLTYCTAGLRSYFALRMLKNSGFNVKNISGGLKMRND